MYTFRGALMILTAMSLTMSMVSPALARGGGRVARAAHEYHPRMREAMGRNRNINRRMDRDYGHLGGNYGKLEGERHNIAQQERKDYKQNGGYLTKGEQHQFNKEDNNLNRQIANDYRGRGNWNRGPGNRGQWNRGQWDKDHPRQAQVLGADHRLGRELNNDKGQLGGNYKTLKSDQQAIRKEDITDRKANGGYITPAQKQQMNQQEKALQQQIKSDYKKPN